jgi:hypothetical protein
MPFQPLLLPLVLILGLAAGCRPEEGVGDAAVPVPVPAPASPQPDPCAVVDLQEGYVCIADPAAPGGVRIEPAS